MARLWNTPYAADASDEFGTEQSRIGCFVNEPPNSSQSYINGRWRELVSFQLHPISKNNTAIEREPGLRAIPVEEFFHGMLVRSARLEGCEAIEDGLLGLFEFG